jgi:LPXTG-site transpeptidase (sortase) family protein
LHQRSISYIIGEKHAASQAHSAARFIVARERHPLADHSLDLLQTLLETPMPSPDARLPRKTIPARSIKTEADALALLQALLETPLVSGDERRPPVTLRSVDSRLDPKPRHPAAYSWFDTLLLRSSQVLLIGSVLVLGYWFVNVPMSNWLHNRRSPAVHASGALPSVAAMRVSPTRVSPTKTAIRVSNAAPDLARLAPQNDLRVPRQRASAVPIAASTAAQAAAPRATAPLTAGQQVRSPALAAEMPPTATVPQPTASPLMLSPTMALLWPTITPVQLGTVSKPSPVPNTPVIAQPAVRNTASALPTRLIIPALGLDVPIKEVFIVDDQWEVAEYAAGYLNGSGLPGVPGNLAMSGHAGLYGAVFASLGALNPGADIYVDAAGVRYHYRLRTSSAFWPNQADILDSTETPTMTLITCTNWDTQRLVATADFVDAGPALDA